MFEIAIRGVRAPVMVMDQINKIAVRKNTTRLSSYLELLDFLEKLLRFARGKMISNRLQDVIDGVSDCGL